MPLLFALTLFVSAALLFAVQPMLGKLLLPLLGGASSVWTTCMVFYQVVLLLGYLYAHLVANRLPRGLQAALQLALVFAAFLLLPFAIPAAAVEELAAGARPVPWLLKQLVLVAGLPFFVVSTTGPLLQRWFSRLGHVASADPYFLYSASNLGSLLALAGYPLWLEPGFEVATQSRFWQWGCLVLSGLLVLCAFNFVRRQPETVTGRQENVSLAGGSPVALTGSQRARWVLLAFVPSSLMLGVTTYFTTDVASIPLLWVIPLGLYLLTFIMAFARRPWLPARWIHRLHPVLGVLLVFTMVCRATEPTWVLVLINLLFFFTTALTCHGRLAADRPPPAQLTEFYLWLSVGGALGGVFNALVAPWLFRDVHEYPLMILLACALYPPPAGDTGPVRWWLRTWRPAAAFQILPFSLALLATALKLTPGLLTNVFIFGLPVALAFGFAARPWRLVAALSGVLIAAQVYVEFNKRTIFVDRSFFGVSRVTVSANGWFRQLDHGSTAHGRQFIEAARACEPLAYYHRTGPLGTIFAGFNRAPAAQDVAVIGLGTGASLAYAQPGQRWDVYEIDPLVIRIARDPDLFRFLSDCSAVTPRVIEGDGRLQLVKARDGQYGLLILDAFSSDAIPMHLLTREAVELYFSKIAEGGWLALHLSNRYLDLEQVIAGLARAEGYAGLSWIDNERDRANGKEESHWIVLARREADLRPLMADPNRIPLESRPAAEPWTDTRSSLLPVFKW